MKVKGVKRSETKINISCQKEIETKSKRTERE